MHTFHNPDLAAIAEVAASLDATMVLPDGAASVFAVATRIAALDQYGNTSPTSFTYSTDQVLKATFAPVMETGDDLVQKNAAGDIIWHYKHGDMPKYWDVTVEFATPDPALESIICGGLQLFDAATALTAPTTAPTATATVGTGTLLGSFYYAYSYANQYGETTLSPYSSVATVATAGHVTLTMTAGTGNAYVNIYRGLASGAGFLLATIPAGTSFTDDGSYGTPVNAPPAANTTAGPTSSPHFAGVGYQAPTLGVVGNPNGFSLEFWSKAIVKGVQASYLPYYRWVIPMCKNFTQQSRDAADAGMQNVYKGQAFENQNWGSGPFADWQFDSTKVFQRARASAFTVPTPGFVIVPATA